MDGLRDEFAKAAMQSLVAAHYEQCMKANINPSSAAEVLADMAYQTADAMLKRRLT